MVHGENLSGRYLELSEFHSSSKKVVICVLDSIREGRRRMVFSKLSNQALCSLYDDSLLGFEWSY